MKDTVVKQLVFGITGILVVAIVVFGFVQGGGEGHAMQEHEHGSDMNAQHSTEREGEEEPQSSSTQSAQKEREESPRDHSTSDHQGEASELSGEIVDGVRVVTVKARRFEFDPSRIVVQKGDDVRLEITSEDVTHGFALEDFDIDRRLEPGKTEKISFQVEKTDQHHFHCPVYCGEGHDKMHGELIVLDRE